MRVYQRLLQILRVALLVPHRADALADNISTVEILHRESAVLMFLRFSAPYIAHKHDEPELKSKLKSASGMKKSDIHEKWSRPPDIYMIRRDQ